MNAIRTALDGLDPRVRFATVTVLGFILIGIIDYLIFRDTASGALRVALVAAVAGVAYRSFQLRTWPWRSPGDDVEPK